MDPKSTAPRSQRSLVRRFAPVIAIVLLGLMFAHECGSGMSDAVIVVEFGDHRPDVIELELIDGDGDAIGKRVAQVRGDDSFEWSVEAQDGDYKVRYRLVENVPDGQAPRISSGERPVTVVDRARITVRAKPR